jgi:hypothetical protein
MRYDSTVLAAGVALLLAMTASAPSFAGDAAPADALTDKAAALYDDGVLAYKKAKFAEARASFLAAWSLKKHWQIAASLADCEAHLGLYRDAAEHFAYFLRTAPQERRTADVEKLYAAAREKIATLAVTVDAPAADVAVDGKVIGKSPLEDPVFVEPGPHAIEARLGATVATAQVDVPQGAARPVDLRVTSAPAPKPSVPIIIAGAGVSAVALGTGIAFFVVSSSKASSADATLSGILHAGAPCTSPPQAGACSNVLSMRQAADTFHNAGVPLLVAGSVIAAGTLAYALWPRSPRVERSGQMRVLPIVGPQAGGLWLTGSF